MATEWWLTLAFGNAGEGPGEEPGLALTTPAPGELASRDIQPSPSALKPRPHSLEAEEAA
ncbi:MAG: hypothetical protein EG825_12885 [Rhodocyclaceae bacterium]|nr:hypothetical protein [Rhodocyclaceae bacterium]